MLSKKTFNLAAKRRTAAAWRKNFDNGRFDGQGGVVFIYQGKAYGWSSETPPTRTANTECPNVFAIEEDGTAWLAVGGDDYNGAEKWELILEKPLAA